MTREDFRRIARSMPQTEEIYRRQRFEFRVRRSTFATLDGPANAMAVLNLTTEQQDMFVTKDPAAFKPVPGGWGRLGITCVLLDAASESALHDIIAAAWSNVAPKNLR
jgi:hypothetical protein